MKKWFSEFTSDMQHIWRTFREEIAEADANTVENDCDETDQAPLFSRNNLPDLDTRKSVNNIDNAYTREMRGTDF
ncbi:hypothetical protein DFO55_12444 [Grimontella sp. AG753]|nr:hypothetical protein DFO55_12444 [Grimontella sp. AG753]